MTDIVACFREELLEGVLSAEFLRAPLPLAPDQHPAAVYLASLSPRSRPTIGGDLNTIA